AWCRASSRSKSCSRSIDRRLRVIDRRLTILQNARQPPLRGRQIVGPETAMAELRKVKASMMNAIHDLPLLVARDEGFFRDEGLDVEIIKTPGSGQKDSHHQPLRPNLVSRTMEPLYA